MTRTFLVWVGIGLLIGTSLAAALDYRTAALVLFTLGLAVTLIGTIDPEL